MNLEIQLRPHVGNQVVTGLGQIEVKFEQWMIFVTGADYKKATGNNDLHVGFAHTKAIVHDVGTGQTFRTPINWLPVANQWPSPIIQRLSTLVQAALAAVPDADPADVALFEAGETRPVNEPPPPTPIDATAKQESAADENL